jgi:hypothetical protein
VQAYLQKPSWLIPAKRQQLIDEERTGRQRALITAENKLASARDLAALMPQDEERKVCSSTGQWLCGHRHVPAAAG